MYLTELVAALTLFYISFGYPFLNTCNNTNDACLYQGWRDGATECVHPSIAWVQPL